VTTHKSKYRLFCATALVGSLCLVANAQNEDKPSAQSSTQEEKNKAPKEKDDKSSNIPPEHSSVTHHEITLGGASIRYAATAGTLLIDNADAKPYGSVFYVAYTQEGVTDPRKRPITFLYNGGPGSATVWLHMGSVGPMRVATLSPKATGAGPYDLVTNQYSLLDKTDLVFIDAVGAGYSRPVGKATEKDFAGVDQDVQAFNRFITKYVSVNQRWNSPKFLFGESYGTTRSAALVDALQNDGMYFNGVVLMSSILNYGIRSPGYDREFIGYLPTYAAIAWHFDKVKNKPSDEKQFLQDVRAFARGPYAEALEQGDTLADSKVNAIAEKLSSYTGLSAQFIKEANLRVSPTRFRKELLRDNRLILGRYDARFEATDVDAAGENPGFDPSSTGITGAFIGEFHDYLNRELKYTSNETYYPSGPNVNRIWDHDHRPGGSEGGGGRQQPQREPYVAGDLADAIRKNPELKVLSVNGLFDLATPFFITEYDLAHMNLDPSLRGNVQFTYYPSGHMIYLNVDALKQLKMDLAHFYDQAAHPSS
jgi:carboxypeptidase C (cathepsin A)